MRRILLIQLLVIITIHLNAQESKLPSWITKKIYIDPTWSGAKKGTLAEPFTNTDDLVIEANTAYLFKRGTTMTGSTKLFVLNKDYSLIGSYGTGKRPHLKFDLIGKIITISGNYCEAHDIELSTPLDLSTHGIIVGSEFSTINNCVIRGGTDCIRVAGVTHLKIKNTDVSGSIFDGLYASDCDTVSIINCYFHDQYVLPNKSNQESIDNIQFETTKMVIIDSLVSDHSNYPGKYCLILNTVDSTTVKNSTFMGHPGNGAVYPGGSKNGLSFENCYFEGGRYALQNNAKLRLTNCIFKGQIEAAIWQGGDKWINNCTFVDQVRCIVAWNSVVRELRNCIFYNFLITVDGNSSDILNHTNCCSFLEQNPSYHPRKGTNPILEDPMFRDYENGDFRLQSASKCIDAGMNIASIKKDFDGSSRDSKIDIGAFEYNSVQPTTYTTTTDGSGCAKDTASVFLSDSEPLINYTLYRNNGKLQQTIVGTGNKLDFGKQSLPGTYSIYAYDPNSHTTAKMQGNVKVLANPLPLETYIIGGGYSNNGTNALDISIKASEADVNYQLYLDNVILGAPVSGTGNGLSLGKFKTNGFYSVKAINKTTGCNIKLSNYAFIAEALTVSQGHIYDTVKVVVKDTIKYHDTLTAVIYKRDTITTTLTIVDNSKIDNSAGIVLAPNPTDGNFTVKTNITPSDLHLIQIINLNGVTVFETKSNLLSPIPISTSLPVGQYLIKISNASTNKLISSHKLIIGK